MFVVLSLYLRIVRRIIMSKLFFTSLFLVIGCFVFGQIKEVLPPATIKTVMIFNPQTNDNTPIIQLGSRDYLLFLFDDLEAGYKRYQYKVEHRNADWSPSGIFDSEYINGYSTDYIRTHKNSFNTYQKFTNYQLQFPNQEMSLKMSGNYILKVFLKDENKPIFTKRFAVYQNSADVGVSVSRYNNPTNADLNQRLQVQVSSGSQNLTESPDAAKLFIMKNNNWDENLLLDNPSFSRNSQLTYNTATTLFEGGGEYNWFDSKNLEVGALTTERSFRKDSTYHTVLRVDYPKYNLPYDDYPDINGNFYIRNNRYGNEYLAASEADYSWVYFALEKFEDQNGLYTPYVVGAFNNWLLNDDSRLEAEENGLWVNEFFLKQGYYNYQYVVKNNKTGKIEPSYVSGSFWQTENSYQALFYYRPWGGRYDLLIGYGSGNSRK